MSTKWQRVAGALRQKAGSSHPWHGVNPTEGQRAAICAIADRIDAGQRSLLIADEVGMGKTLIAATLAAAVGEAGGRVAAVIPPGIGNQWRSELERVEPAISPLLPLRSIWTLLDAFRKPIQGQNGKRAENKRKKYEERSLQKELPKQTWREEKVLLLSHNLGGFRWTENQADNAGRLLRQLHNALNGKRRYIRDSDELFAREVADHLCKAEGTNLGGVHRELLKYGDDPRHQFHVLLGLALGSFDLVVLDEAHKARGSDSSISRVVGSILRKQEGCFHLGLSATPIELDNVQWVSTLGRLNVPRQKLDAIRATVERYDAAIMQLKRGALTDVAIAKFAPPAQEMVEILRPWVIRRDLRDDAWMQRFLQVALQKGVTNHRARRSVPVPFGEIDLQWKRAFMASEALALKAENNIPLSERRLRLGLAAGIDADPAVIDEQVAEELGSASPWRALVLKHGASDPDRQFRHPLILAAIDLIENKVLGPEGEKVLVFGRFNTPMSALTHLLDMRELVRRLDRPDHFEWSQTGLLDNQRAAFAVAFESRAATCPITDPKDIDRFLGEQYRHHERIRRPLRESAHSILVELLEREGLEASDRRVSRLWRALERQTEKDVRKNGAELRAALDQHFMEMVADCREEDPEGKAVVEPLATSVDDFLDGFEGRLGHFASFLHGGLSPQTRRNLQVGFNKRESWPRVLVAQSRIASEGLNLQTACRTIVMFHPEWNPAICEQQIGRVDRLGSLWRERAQEYLTKPEEPNDPPRIEILIPFIKGTYAEYNLRVLETRWDRLRAQLHGDILELDNDQQKDDVLRAHLEEVKRLTPSFSPSGPNSTLMPRPFAQCR